MLILADFMSFQRKLEFLLHLVKTSTGANAGHYPRAAGQQEQQSPKEDVHSIITRSLFDLAGGRKTAKWLSDER